MARSRSSDPHSSAEPPSTGRTPAGTVPTPHGADRFNEDKATYALRGADQPDLDGGVAVIREVVATLNLEDLQRAPGVSAAVAQAVYDFYHPAGRAPINTQVTDIFQPLDTMAL
eukprot:gene9087-9168_t